LIVQEYSSNAINDELWLHDRYNDTWTKLQQGTAHEFAVTSDSATQGEHRLEIVKRTYKPIVADNEILQVYPNPATDMVNIKCGNSDEQLNTVVKIVDEKGRTVRALQAGRTTAIDQQINLQSLAGGVYIIEVANGKYKRSKTIVKQ